MISYVKKAAIYIDNIINYIIGFLVGLLVLSYDDGEQELRDEEMRNG